MREKLELDTVTRGGKIGFNFRKSFKIAPGIRLNVGKKGISSVSLGTKSGRVNVGKKDLRSTVSVLGTGLSYTAHQPFKQTRTNHSIEEQSNTLFNETPPALPNHKQEKKYFPHSRSWNIFYALYIRLAYFKRRLFITFQIF